MRIPGKMFRALALLFLFSGNLLFAQNLRPWWLAMEQGKLYFRSGAYGNALLAFEDARRTRLNQFSQMESDLILTLSAPEFRRMGDSLSMVENYCTEWRQDGAARALRELYYHYPKTQLNDSVNRALEELDRLKSYPEAEFWIGETYRAEGELGLALKQYQKAYGERSLLEIPGFEVEILYKITDLHRIRQEYQEMENRALEILKGPPEAPRDFLWAGENEGFTRAAMMRILENEGIGRFLTLYRYNNPPVEKAHRLLGFFYYASSRHTQAAEHLMFSFLIQNTLLIEEVLHRQFDYSFSSLDALMESISRRQDLREYLEEVEYFRTLYYLGAALYATGKQVPARQIWTFLSGQEGAAQWRSRARSQLQSPYIEKAIEAP